MRVRQIELMNRVNQYGQKHSCIMWISISAWALSYKIICVNLLQSKVSTKNRRITSSTRAIKTCMIIIELIILLVSLNLRFYKDLSIICFALCAT